MGVGKRRRIRTDRTQETGRNDVSTGFVEGKAVEDLCHQRFSLRCDLSGKGSEGAAHGLHQNRCIQI